VGERGGISENAERAVAKPVGAHRRKRHRATDRRLLENHGDVRRNIRRNTG